MEEQVDPLLVDVVAFVKSGRAEHRTEAVSQFPRLAEEVFAGKPSVRWSVSGELRDASGQAQEPWLHVQAIAQLPMQCQNCLEQVQVDLQVGRWIRFAKDEARALLEDETSEEDVLALSDSFDLRSLVEDELLMALPMVPRHEHCAMERGGVAGHAQALEHPFAALAAWKH